MTSTIPLPTKKRKCDETDSTRTVDDMEFDIDNSATTTQEILDALQSRVLSIGILKSFEGVICLQENLKKKMDEWLPQTHDDSYKKIVSYTVVLYYFLSGISGSGGTRPCIRCHKACQFNSGVCSENRCGSCRKSVEDCLATRIPTFKSGNNPYQSVCSHASPSFLWDTILRKMNNKNGFLPFLGQFRSDVFDNCKRSFRQPRYREDVSLNNSSAHLKAAGEYVLELQSPLTTLEEHLRQHESIRKAFESIFDGMNKEVRERKAGRTNSNRDAIQSKKVKTYSEEEFETMKAQREMYRKRVKVLKRSVKSKKQLIQSKDQLIQSQSMENDRLRKHIDNCEQFYTNIKHNFDTFRLNPAP